VRRLTHRLDLATGRDVDRPARQQSLRTAIAWSYDLLGLQERRLFRLLGTFAGPCSLEAIEAVAGSPGLLETLDELVAQSLVRRLEGDDGESSFEMLVTIREFAVEELRANGEAAPADEQFCAYYLALAEESVAGLRGPLQISWANRLATETPNLVKTMNRLLEGKPEPALRLIAALGSYWIYRSQLSVGREWSERAFPFADAAPLAAARVRFNAAVIARDQGDVDLAQRYLETSLRQFQTHSSARGVALCLNFLGLLALQKGDYTLARQRVMASRAIHERINSQWGIGWTYLSLGTIFEQQRRLPRARALFDRARAILDDIGDVRGVAAALSGLGNVQRLLGEFDGCRANLERALELQRQSRHLSGAEVTLLALSGVAHHERQFGEAHEYIDEAIRIATRIGDLRNLPTAHAFRIVVLKSEGRFAEARRLAEQILAMYRERGDVPWMALLHATIADLADRAGAADAADYFRQSLQWLSVVNDRWIGARTIALIGLSAARHGRLADALRALGAAQATYPAIRTNFDYSNYTEWETVESQACEQLGLLGATVVFDDGKAMDFGQAVAFARSLLAGATLPSAPSVRDNPYSSGTRLG
ncbi:MAG TPA: tetratricopeptide repeat protein, partial [Chloroflexota bacterium]|nr:tetratricopeptide repeat protein [Chloroflexota bacterium]